MIKQTIVALILSRQGRHRSSRQEPSRCSAMKSGEAKTLTGAEHLIDLVGQPQLANSWWPGAVISEELAHGGGIASAAGVADRLAETNRRLQRRRCRRN